VCNTITSHDLALAACTKLAAQDKPRQTPLVDFYGASWITPANFYLSSLFIYVLKFCHGASEELAKSRQSGTVLKYKKSNVECAKRGFLFKE
jgi:hypothetical protein